jgi:hypothetical protein
MSARRWSVLLAFTLVSVLVSVGWFVWAAIKAPPGQRMSAMGIAGILQLIELPLAYYLLRLSDYARDWTFRLNLTKLVGAVGLILGGIAGRVLSAEVAAALVAVAVFYTAYALFLRANAEFFG